MPIVIGALGTIAKGLLKGLEDLEVGGRVETIQTTALLRTARILRRVLETRCHSISSQKPSANTDVKNSKGVHKYNYNNNLDLARELKKLKHESDSDTNCNWSAPYSHQRIGTGIGGFWNKRTSGDHLNYCTVEIGQKTEEIPGDLKRLAVTKTPVKTIS